MKLTGYCIVQYELTDTVRSKKRNIKRGHNQNQRRDYHFFHGITSNLPKQERTEPAPCNCSAHPGHASLRAIVCCDPYRWFSDCFCYFLVIFLSFSNKSFTEKIFKEKSQESKKIVEKNLTRKIWKKKF